MVAKTAMKIGIGIALAAILSLSGTVVWLKFGIAQLETDLAAEQAKCARLQGELANCQGNEATLQSALDRQNAALADAHQQAQESIEQANARAETARKQLQARVETDRHISTDAAAMNAWLKSLFLEASDR